MELVFIWIVLSLIVGIFAGNYGRSWFGWFVQALVISPVFSVIFLAYLHHIERSRKRDEMLAELLKRQSN